MFNPAPGQATRVVSTRCEQSQLSNGHMYKLASTCGAVMHMAFKARSGMDVDISGYLFSFLVFIFFTSRRVHGSIRGKITGVQRDLQVGEVSPGGSITTHYTLARDSALTRGKGLDIQSASTDFPRDRVYCLSAARRRVHSRFEYAVATLPATREPSGVGRR